MDLRLEDFIPSYPQYELNQDDLFNVYGQRDMYDVIQRKKEFTELTLTKVEDPNPHSVFLKHQLFIQRFISGHTPYSSILVWHEVGTGKTATSIAVAEGMKQFQGSRALVLVKGETIANNFNDELRNRLPALYRDDAEGAMSKRKSNLAIEHSYEINTFRKFCSGIMNRNKQHLKEQYSNRVIIIDEVHNLRKEEKKHGGDIKIYDIIKDLLHSVENCKILLLSATPMKDRPSEFAAIMNLILPPSKQFQIDTFESTFFNEDTLVRKKEIIDKTKGYISYLRQTYDTSILKVENEGEPIQHNGFHVVPLIMEKYQSTEYNKSYLIDKKEGENKGKSESSLYENSRQSILACYPEYHGNTYGKSSHQDRIGYNPQYYTALAHSMIYKDKENKALTLDEKLEHIKQYSIKYHYILSAFFKKDRRKQFVYCRFIDGSGLFLLKHLLQALGGHYAKNAQFQTKEKRFIMITSELNATQINTLLNKFNSPENRYGEYIQMVLGSPTLGESRSLKCIRELYILTPHWNYTETEQAIGRGIRYKSHELLAPEERTISIYRLVAIPLRTEAEKKKVLSIDQYMYEMSYKKDVKLKQIEYVAREIAVDCTLNKARNTLVDFDDQRECFYTSCEYDCYRPVTDANEYKDTYHLFYTEKEYRLICDALQSMFQTHATFSYTLTMIQSQCARYGIQFPTHVIIRCIRDIIERKEPFVNPLGTISYLKEYKDTYFLSYQLLHAKESDVYYTKQINLYPSVDYKDFMTRLEHQNIDRIISTMKQSPQYIDAILDELSDPFKDQLRQAVNDVYRDMRKADLVDLVDKLSEEKSDDISDDMVRLLVEDLLNDAHAINVIGIQAKEFKIISVSQDVPRRSFWTNQKNVKGGECTTSTANRKRASELLRIDDTTLKRDQVCDEIRTRLERQTFPSVPHQPRVISEELRERIVAYINTHMKPAKPSKQAKK